MDSIFICFLGDFSKCYFKTVTFSSYFHFNYSLFGQVLHFANILAFQDFFLFKNYISSIVLQGLFFSKPMGYIYVIICHYLSLCLPWLILFITFLFLRFLYNNFVSIFILVSCHTADKNTVPIYSSIIQEYNSSLCNMQRLK